MEYLDATIATFVLVLLAELGDKSQLICLALAARHRALPVFLGAVAAFLPLTAMAALLGAALVNWIPEMPLHFALAALYALFGFQMLRHTGDADTSLPSQLSAHSIFIATFLLIALSEMGDKTQLLILGRSTVEYAVGVFIGAILALTISSALGVWAGSRWLNGIWLTWFHRIGGMLFFVFAALAGFSGYQALV